MTEPAQWTEDRLEILKKLWTEGMSITQIGEALGVSRNSIAGKVHRLGLPKRQSPILGKTASDAASETASKTTKKAAPKTAKKTAPKTAGKTSVPITPPEPIVWSEDSPLKLVLRNLDWSRNKCSWPTGDPQNTDFKFCGKKVVAGKPYCNDHCFEAYTTTREGAG